MNPTSVDCLPLGLVRYSQMGASAEGWQEGEGTGGWGWAAILTHRSQRPQTCLSMLPLCLQVL